MHTAKRTGRVEPFLQRVEATKHQHGERNAMSEPILVWHSCGANYGYRIPWGELMANGIWPWGADMDGAFSGQKYISLINRGLLDIYRDRDRYRVAPGLLTDEVLLARMMEAPGVLAIVQIDHYVKSEAIDTPALIAAIKHEWLLA